MPFWTIHVLASSFEITVLFALPKRDQEPAKKPMVVLRARLPIVHIRPSATSSETSGHRAHLTGRYVALFLARHWALSRRLTRHNFCGLR
jgi:hypothetical protein